MPLAQMIKKMPGRPGKALAMSQETCLYPSENIVVWQLFIVLKRLWLRKNEASNGRRGDQLPLLCFRERVR